MSAPEVTPEEAFAYPPTRRKRKPVALVVVSVSLLAALVASGVCGYAWWNTKKQLTATQGTLASTQWYLWDANQKLTAAQTKATAWEVIADNWRKCAVESLGVATGLLDSGIIGGLAPIGAAEATCSAARSSQNAVSGGAA